MAFDTRVKAIVFFLHFEIAPLFQPLPLPLRCTSTLEENSITIRVSPPFACETALTCFASNDIYCLVGNEEIYSLIEKRELRKARFWKIRFRREFLRNIFFYSFFSREKFQNLSTIFMHLFFSIGKSSWFSYIIVTIFKQNYIINITIDLKMYFTIVYMNSNWQRWRKVATITIRDWISDWNESDFSLWWN